MHSGKKRQRWERGRNKRKRGTVRRTVWERLFGRAFELNVALCSWALSLLDKCVACLPVTLFPHLQQLLEIQKSNMKFKSNIGSLRDAHECKEDHLPSPQDLQNMLQLLEGQVWRGQVCHGWWPQAQLTTFTWLLLLASTRGYCAGCIQARRRALDPKELESQVVFVQKGDTELRCPQVQSALLTSVFP